VTFVAVKNMTKIVIQILQGNAVTQNSLGKLVIHCTIFLHITCSVRLQEITESVDTRQSYECRQSENFLESQYTYASHLTLPYLLGGCTRHISAEASIWAQCATATDLMVKEISYRSFCKPQNCPVNTVKSVQ